MNGFEGILEELKNELKIMLITGQYYDHKIRKIFIIPIHDYRKFQTIINYLKTSPFFMNQASMKDYFDLDISGAMIANFQYERRILRGENFIIKPDRIHLIYPCDAHIFEKEFKKQS